jgi:hypothetical protein
LPALRRAAFALGARPTVDQFTAPLLRALLLARPRLFVELRVCAIVHAQLAADIGMLQRELMMAATTATTSMSSGKPAAIPSAQRPTMSIRAMTSMTRNAMHSLSGGGVDSSTALCSPSVLDRSQRHAAQSCEVDEEDQTLHDDYHLQSAPMTTASNRLVPHHATADVDLLRLVNLHDCAEHGGFVGSSRGPLHLQQQLQDLRPTMQSESHTRSSEQQISFRPSRHPLHRLSFAGAD